MTMAGKGPSPKFSGLAISSVQAGLPPERYEMLSTTVTRLRASVGTSLLAADFEFGVLQETRYKPTDIIADQMVFLNIDFLFIII